MSTGVLQALMQLFAIITKSGGDNGLHNNGRDVIAIFLRQQLNRDLVKKFLASYDEFVAVQQAKRLSNNGRKKTASLNSVKILKICTQINEELTQKEKVFVLLRLLEFTKNSCDELQIAEFIEVVSDTFNISRNIFDDLKALVKSTSDDVIDNENFIYACGDDEWSYAHAKFIEKCGLKGKLVFYRVEGLNMFFLKEFGVDELTLNGQVLTSSNIQVFNQGASIRSPKISPVYYSDVIGKTIEGEACHNIEFKAENISYYFKGGKQALHQLNLVEKSGNLIGIMGGSGSGKSTLLNVLNGNYKPSFGSVKINGIDIHKRPKDIEGVIGHIAQDDLLIEELTVYDNLYFNAELCFKDDSPEHLEGRTLEALNSLGLFEARNLKVGTPLDKTISGGQRKRLNIALELIREPSVLFVDEPTSGLSSRDSENIMDLLKELTLKGKLVFVVIHQPSSAIFKMFDKLFLLDQGGYPIYYGDPVESVIYFKKLVNHANLEESECSRCGIVNPEQIFNIIESKVVDEYGKLTEHRKISPREWNNFFNVIIGNHISKEFQTLEAPHSLFKIPSLWKQFKVFLKRDVLSKLANTQYLMVNFLEAPALALILSFFIKFFQPKESEQASYIFRESENLPQFLFISVIVSLFLGLTVSAEEIIRDQKIIKREKFLNLSRGSYLISKIGIMFFISAVQALTYVVVGNVVLEIKGMWLEYWMILFSTSCFANLLGLNISASFNSAKVIYIIIPILIIPQLLFSGVIVKFDKLYPLFSSQSEVPLIGNVMASRWAYEALAVHQFTDNKFSKEFYSFEKDKKYYIWKKDYWLKELNNKINKCKKNFNDPESSIDLSYELNIIKNELEKEKKLVPGLAISTAEIGRENISREKIAEIETTLIDLRDFYLRKYSAANIKKENRLAELMDVHGGREAYLLLRDEYSNISLEDFVTNSNDLNPIVEYQNELVQKSNPIYLTPTKGFFDAHFYSPTKNFFGIQISTFVANSMVIWLMILLLSVLLFFDGLRKVIEFSSQKSSELGLRLVRRMKN
jgi:ABC-type multidrug transport system ATPase subunit|tara:strand:+ start:8305 stop:11400 length:3096 start_codon:yes stop_codon:yes gene_type:complete